MCSRRRLLTLAVGLLAAASLVYAQARSLLEAAPETMGFSPERLQRLDDAMRAFVDRKELAGVIAAVARHGKLVHFRGHGSQDLADRTPLREDTIFRIYSMNKPITGVAMMMLYEEGKWNPSDAFRRAARQGYRVDELHVATSPVLLGGGEQLMHGMGSCDDR